MEREADSTTLYEVQGMRAVTNRRNGEHVGTELTLMPMFPDLAGRDYVEATEAFVVAARTTEFKIGQVVCLSVRPATEEETVVARRTRAETLRRKEEEHRQYLEPRS